MSPVATQGVGRDDGDYGATTGGVDQEQKEATHVMPTHQW